MSTKKTVIVAVINDVSSDQRVHKVCSYLVQNGFNVIARGRKLTDTFDVKKPYKVIHKKHWFNSRFIFYIEYNVRLLWFLLLNKSDYILSNDLDTLPACFIASKLKKTELVYDSHEYFTETPELEGRKTIKKIWLLLENIFLPRLKKVYTVSEAIANSYLEKYATTFGVVKNFPILNNDELIHKTVVFPTNNKVLLYQGKLTKNRGLYQVIESLHYLESIDLVIIGHGKEKENLVSFTKKQQLEKRVHFLGRIPYEELYNYTKKADLGILLEEPVGTSFKYALPNKLFDYIHCELPFICYPLQEVKKIVETYNIGVFVKNHKPKHIAEEITRILNNKELYKSIKSHQKIAKKEFCWEKECKLLDIYFK